MILHLDNIDSTNSYVAANADRLAHGDAVEASQQTAGRGQRGNSWESEPGANVTMSVILRPSEVGVLIHAARSFPLSEAVALAVADVVIECLPSHLVDKVAIKWPNDIYVADKKIAGILIENTLAGPMISRSIVGLGLNVNQRRFFSDAPNPVSLIQLSGDENVPSKLVVRILDRLMERFELISDAPDRLHSEYMNRLWRGVGLHQFIDAQTDERFLAEVVSIESSGHIQLRLHPDGQRRTYAFKEIVWL